MICGVNVEMSLTLLLVLTCLLYCKADLAETSTVTLDDDDLILRELKIYMNEKIRKFKIDLHKSFESARIRHKRNSGELLEFVDNNAAREHIQINQDASDSVSHYTISCWTAIQIYSDHLLILLTNTNEVVFLNFNGVVFNKTLHLSLENVPLKAKAFLFGKHVWLLVMHQLPSGIFYIQMYRYDGRNLFKKQSIPLAAYSDVDILFNRGMWYLSVGTASIDTQIGHVLLYEWRNTQFDLIAKEKCSGVQSIALWELSGVLYLAAARYEDATEGSLIFSYDRRNFKLIISDLISTNYASQVFHFTIGLNHYLIFTTPEGASLFWWAENEFLFFQLLENTRNLVSVDVLLLPNGEVTIAVALANAIIFFTENYASKYIPSYILNTPIDVPIGSALFFTQPSFAFLLVTYHPLDSASGVPTMLYKLNISRDFDNFDRLDPLSSCLHSLNDNIAINRKQLDHIDSLIDRVWVTNKVQTVSASITIKGNMDVDKELITNNVIISTDAQNVPQVTNSDLKLSVVNQKSELEWVKAESHNIVYKSKDQTIFGPLTFLTTPIIQNGLMPSISQNVELNGVPLSRLGQTLKTSGVQVFTGEITMDEVKSNNLFVDGTINQINTEDLILLNGPNITVTGNLTFNDISVDELNLLPGGTVNKIEPRTIALADGAQIINGTKTFSSLIVNKRVVVRRNTNGKDLSTFSKDIVTMGQVESAAGNLEIKAPLIIEGDLRVSGLVNGFINLTKLATEAVTKKGHQKIQGSKIFKSLVYINEDVVVTGLTNGIDVSEDVFTLDTSQTIRGHMTFSSPLSFAGDLSTVNVNGLDLSEEAVTTFGKQTITGQKRFEGSVKVNGAITMAPLATINNVNFVLLDSMSVNPENFTLYGTTIFSNMSAKYVDYSNVNNGFGMNIQANSLWRKSINQNIPVPLNFASPIFVENDLEVGTSVNELNLKTDIIHTYDDEEINGFVTFDNDVYVEEPMVVEEGVKLNDFDLSVFKDTVINSNMPAHFVESKEFVSLEVKGDVIVNGALNGIHPSEQFLSLDRPQEIRGHMHFKAPITIIAGNVVSDTVDLKNDISGLDFRKFVKETVFENDARGIPIEFKEFSQPLKAINVQAFGTIDSVNVNELTSRAMLITAPSVNLNSHNFTDIKFTSDVRVKLINGVPFEDFLETFVVVGETKIRGSKTLEGPIRVDGNLRYSGNLNGIDFPNLVARTAIKTSNNFSAPVIIRGDLFVDTLWVSDNTFIDDVPFSEVLSLTSEQFLTGKNIFVDDVIVGRDVVLNGPMNNCDLKTLAQTAIYTNLNNQVIETPVNVGHLLVNGNLKVQGDINGVNVLTLASEIVTKSGSQTLKGDFVFESGVTVDNLFIKNTINKVDLSFLLTDVVSKSSPQVVSGKKNFTHLTGLAVDSDLTVHGDIFPTFTVNGVDLSVLHDTTVLNFVDQTITGHKRFSEVHVSGDIYINGRLNGISIPNDLILINTSDIIATPIHVIGQTTVLGSMFLEKNADGVNLNHLISQRVSLKEQEIVNAELTFVEKVRAESLKIKGAVNDIPIKTVILKSQNYIIEGTKSIVGNIIIESDLEVDLLNNISMRQFDQQIVRYDREEIVYGPTVFIAPINITRDIVVEATINGLQVESIQNQFIIYERNVNDLTQQLVNAAESQELEILDLMITREKCSYAIFAYFDLVQILDVPTVKVLSTDISNLDTSKVTSTLVAWTLQNCNDLDQCCPLSTIFIGLDGTGVASVFPDSHQQRLFPFIFGDQLPSNSDALRGFLLWTNSTSASYDCPTYSIEKTSIVTLLGDGTDQIPINLNGLTYEISDSPYIKDSELFEIDGQFFMIIAHSYDKARENRGTVEIYRYDHTRRHWGIHQTLSAVGISDISLEIDFDLVGRIKYILLAVAAKTPGISQIHIWIMEINQFQLLSVVPTSWPSSVIWVKVHSAVYAVFANEYTVIEPGVPVYSEPVTIFTYTYNRNNKHSIQQLQEIPIYGIIDLETFSFGGETYILAASGQTQMVYVIMWKGFASFEIVQEFPVPSIRDLHVFYSKNELYVAASSVCGTTILKAIADGGAQPITNGKI